VLIKLDENLGERGRQMLSHAGHAVAIVGEEGLAGADDPRVIGVCAAEHRCLVSLGLDFSNPFVFPPEQFAGIAVLRLPRRLTPGALYSALGTLINALAQRPIKGKLWIVEGYRIREYLPEIDSDQPEPGRGLEGHE
jgi:Domain of unknown function (DUF5615)